MPIFFYSICGMKSKVLKLLCKLFISFWGLFIFFSCVSNKNLIDGQGNESSNQSTDNNQQESLAEEEQKKEIPTWKRVNSIDEIRGVWKSSDGNEFEWPLVLNGNKYLRIAYTENDVTEDFVNYAKNHNMDFNKLWAHRYAYLGNIYGVKLQDGRLVPSPYSHDNGIQQGIKLRADYTRPYSRNIGFRIFARNETLVPESIARSNASFFMLLGDDKINLLKGNGIFYGGTFNLYSDSQVYKKFEDYWAK